MRNQKLESAELAKLSSAKMLKAVQINKQIIDSYYSPQIGDSVLVAGAGIGLEAIIIKREFKMDTVAVDLKLEPDLFNTKDEIVFKIEDLTRMSFEDERFSIVYNNHVLEHVLDASAALFEMSRVLRPGGVLFIGFPNRNRLIGYLNPSQNVSLADILAWNLTDYKNRILGRFTNETGAHAGFTHQEFKKLAERCFKTVYPVRDQYMKLKYSKYLKLIQLAIRYRLDEYMFPSNYYLCIK